MPTRTLLSAFPSMRLAEFNTYKPISAELIRRLAQAQNYLWANLVRVYANHAYEGNGCFHGYGMPDALEGDLPLGKRGIHVATFYAPTRVAASSRLKVRTAVQAYMRTPTSATTGSAIVQLSVHNLDGSSIGRAIEIIATPLGDLANGYHAANGYLQMPSDGRDYEVRVYIAMVGAAPDGGGGFDWARLHQLSVRYDTGTAADLGDTPPATWRPHRRSLSIPSFAPASSAILRTIAENTLHLWANRTPEICQSWLADSHTRAMAWVEVGRYDVLVRSPCTRLRVALTVKTNINGSNTRVRFYVDATNVYETVVSTSDSLLEFTVTTTSGEHAFSVQARIDDSGISTSFIDVVGVYVEEYNDTFDTLVGEAVPVTFQPLDEALLQANDPVRKDADLGAARVGFNTLVANDCYLAKYRGQVLVADWRHRTLKRYNRSDPGSPYSGIQWDWTLGPDWQTFQEGRPRNITLRGSNSSDSSAQNDVDGRPTDVYGFSTQNNIGDFADWPGPSIHNYPTGTHGRRLALYEFRSTGGEIMNCTGASYRVVVRARRLRPAYIEWRGVVHPNIGPGAEEAKWTNRAYLMLLATAPRNFYAAEQRLNIVGAHSTPDHLPAWYGPVSIPHQVAWNDGYLRIHGRCPNPAGVFGGDEGHYFEVELTSGFACDNTLTQAQLDAIP